MNLGETNIQPKEDIANNSLELSVTITSFMKGTNPDFKNIDIYT